MNLRDLKKCDCGNRPSIGYTGDKVYKVGCSGCGVVVYGYYRNVEANWDAVQNRLTQKGKEA